jgi:hypothetical protein
VRIGGTFNYDDPTVQQQLAQTHIAILAYYKGWTNSSRSMNSVVANVKAASPFTSFPTKVFLYINNEQFHDDGSDSVVTDAVTQLDSTREWLYNKYSQTGSSSDNRTHDPQSQNNPNIFLTNTTQFPQDGGSAYGWVNWYANWINTWYYQKNTAIDGFFTDNFAVQPLADGDYNQDGVTDTASDPTVAGWFRDGMRQHITTLRSLIGSNEYELANIGDWGLPGATYPEYSNLLNGGLLEGYIGKPYSPENISWTEMMSRYRKVMAAVIAPKLLIFGEWGSTTDYQTMRYGLTSCLMDDGYFAFTDNATADYGSTPLFDEYKVALGYPTDPPPTAAWSNGVYRRNFQNGTVLVNPKGNNNGAAVTVTLEPGYKHFSGTQDSTTNNGAVVTSVTLQPRDGVILIKAQ